MSQTILSRVTPSRVLGAVALILAALGPVVFSSYWVSFVLTQTFWFGIAAASMVFLSAYGGMVSLGQAAMYGVAGFVLGNVVTSSEAKGMHLHWNPWVGVVLAIVITTAVGLLLGAVASRSAGIYFLMLTLTFGVLVYYFFSTVTIFSGFSGVSSIQVHAPSLLGKPPFSGAGGHPNRLYYVALVVAVLVYLSIRYLVKTPFGITLQGIRDEPVRMASLGYNVPLHRTLAFGFAAFVASLAGVLFVWWNDHIDPTSIGLGGVVNLLIAGVIGGLYRLEGAWVGAFAFVLINNYTHDVSIPGVGGSFDTVIGLIFLAIVLVSPNGLLGIWQWLEEHVTRQLGSHGPAAFAGAGAKAEGD